MVRRNVGYYHYNTARELDLLNQLWPLVSIQVNPFLPQQTLLSKTRHGARLSKKHDQATTPLDRLLTGYHDMVDPDDRTQLETLRHDTDLHIMYDDNHSTAIFFAHSRQYLNGLGRCPNAQ